MSKQTFQLRTPLQESLHRFGEARKAKRARTKCQAEDYPPELKFGLPASQERGQGSLPFANAKHSQEEIDAANEMRKRRCGERDD